jgi:hypothetical protein
VAAKTFDPIDLGPIAIIFSVDAEMSNGSATVSRCDVHAFMAGDAHASFLAIATPGVFGPDYFLEIAAVIAAAEGPPDPQAMAAVMLRHGLTPVPS